ncbi:type II toxin-antitoxin system HicA family toxin [Clostridium perfringens]|uniref:type II toxin-antitoxin system HicA family toxin n=1 Tax=Clostridium perfringens TaxID=1502 RepID=UPI0024BCDC91|nr:type II toxin-antitoxin system HicA family toxin [Clostridium perfringens]
MDIKYKKLNQQSKAIIEFFKVSFEDFKKMNEENLFVAADMFAEELKPAIEEDFSNDRLDILAKEGVTNLKKLIVMSDESKIEYLERMKDTDIDEHKRIKPIMDTDIKNFDEDIIIYMIEYVERSLYVFVNHVVEQYLTKSILTMYLENLDRNIKDFLQEFFNSLPLGIKPKNEKELKNLSEYMFEYSIKNIDVVYRSNVIKEFFICDAIEEIDKFSQGITQRMIIAFYNEFKDLLNKEIIEDIDEKIEDNNITSNIYKHRSWNDLEREAKNKGYTLKRCHGDHGIYENKDGLIVVIPRGRDIGKGLQIRIMKRLS